ncbi:Oidioi.mRNA.OKI2018_I69.chr2.g3977.t1.cds [Oikopleura dioica]|uniref:Hexosyltransferase n=1 Tax=Oikopleura dioica TaxID=34765 RepID=A0ABN7T1D6_OIKDI|nr:Oidioi.mRNA.OKI2018_I69.chr2.g3977.t1.cds [Oikopleura dioica]
MRNTWLNPQIWRELGYDIRVVFLLGNPGDIDLSAETRVHEDVLILDFTESHYNLPFKDKAFLQFFAENCSHADFLFKGDDDIFLRPEKFVKIFEEIEDDEAIGCCHARRIDLKSENAGYPEDQSLCEGSRVPEPVRDPTSKYFIPRQFVNIRSHTLIGLESGAMLMLGGYNIEGFLSNDYEGSTKDIWLLKDKIWTQIGVLNEYCEDGSALKIDDYIYLVSGGIKDSNGLYPVERIKIVNDEVIHTKVIGGHEFRSEAPVIFEASANFCV